MRRKWHQLFGHPWIMEHIRTCLSQYDIEALVTVNVMAWDAICGCGARELHYGKWVTE